MCCRLNTVVAFVKLCLTLLWPHELQPTMFLCLDCLDFPGKHPGVGCHFLLHNWMSHLLCCPTKIHILGPNPKLMVWRSEHWDMICHAGGALVNVICALIIRDMKQSLHLWGCSKKVSFIILQTRKPVLTSSTLVLDFPASRTMRKKKCLLFQAPSLWYLLQQPEKKQHEKYVIFEIALSSFIPSLSMWQNSK